MPDLDLLIRGATVYPGDGAPFEGDIGVRGATIDLVAQSHQVFSGAGQAASCSGSAGWTTGWAGRVRRPIAAAP